MIFQTFHVGYWTYGSNNIWDFYEFRPTLTPNPHTYLKDAIFDVMMHPESKFILNFYEGSLRPTDHHAHSYLVLKYQELENLYPMIDKAHHPKVTLASYYTKSLIDDRKDEIEQYLEQNHIRFEYIDDSHMYVFYDYPNIEHIDHATKN